MEFQCSGCGLCCRLVGDAVRRAQDAVRQGSVNKLAKWLSRFPYKFDKEGVCEKLVDGKCSIYERRPAVCQVEMSRKLFTGEGKVEYYNRAAKRCNELIRKAGLPETFIVKEDYQLLNEVRHV